MRQRVIEAGPLRVFAVGEGDGPSVVLCHGYGATGTDLVGLHSVVNAGPGVRWFFPEAPLDLSGMFGQPARAWWPIDMMKIQLAMMRGDRALEPTEVPPGFVEARDGFSACLEALSAKHGLDASRAVIGGFSQGSMLAQAQFFGGARRYAGLAVLSGAPVALPVWRDGLAANGPAATVFQSHGQSDPILPFRAAMELGATLDGAGVTREWVPFRGQHEIPQVVVAGLGAWLQKRLQPAA